MASLHAGAKQQGATLPLNKRTAQSELGKDVLKRAKTGHQQGLRLAKPAGQATTELSIPSLRAASITLFKGLEKESQAIFMGSLKEVTASSKALQRTAEGECSSTSEMLGAAQTVVNNFRGQHDTRSAAVRDAKQTFDKAFMRVEQEQLARVHGTLETANAELSRLQATHLAL